MNTQLQYASDGIIYEGYDKDYIVCRYAQEPVGVKDELYIFRCDAEKACCGRECCIPETGIPLWLLILLLILLFLLLLALCLGILYYCWKLCKQRPKPSPKPSKPKPPPPPIIRPDPMDFMVLPEPQPIPVEFHTQNELSVEQLPLLTHSLLPREQKPKIIYYREATDQVASY